MGWEVRDYRRHMDSPGLVAFHVMVAQTDLRIHAATDLTDLAEKTVRDLRGQLERYIAAHPRFAESFVPVPVEDSAPAIVLAMARAAQAAGVGPMAAVAGAVAEAVARALSARSAEVIVENGGDLYLMGGSDRVVGVWAGEQGVRGLRVRVPASLLPCAVATSSGRIGPSVSLGSADTATVLASSGALADAVASLVGNRIHTPDDLGAAVAAGYAVDGVHGVLASMNGALAAIGAIELVPGIE